METLQDFLKQEDMCIKLTKKYKQSDLGIDFSKLKKGMGKLRFLFNGLKKYYDLDESLLLNFEKNQKEEHKRQKIKTTGEKKNKKNDLKNIDLEISEVLKLITDYNESFCIGRSYAFYMKLKALLKDRRKAKKSPKKINSKSKYMVRTEEFKSFLEKNAKNRYKNKFNYHEPCLKGSTELNLKIDFLHFVEMSRNPNLKLAHITIKEISKINKDGIYQTGIIDFKNKILGGK